MINAVSFESITITVLKNFSTEANSRIPTLLCTVYLISNTTYPKLVAAIAIKNS